jgi:UDP-N-acetylmuramate dehydrogenase
MEKRRMSELNKIAGEGIRWNCPMARYTTFRVGGQAEAYYEVNELKELQAIIKYSNQNNFPYLVMGRGSNLIIKDEGLEGLVIRLRGKLANIELQNRAPLSLVAGAGASVSDLLNYCRENELGGLEFLAGIPGTIGGAVTMNAGAFGDEIASKIEKVCLINSQGKIEEKDRSQLNFGYRRFEIEKGAVIIKVWFGMERKSSAVIGKQISEYLEIRKRRQPLEFPSAGSAFKNPPNEHAAKLIERSGLKGFKIGGAMVSPKHANFIVNTGGATAKDIISLLSVVRDTVKKKTGITLEPEIRVIGR